MSTSDRGGGAMYRTLTNRAGLWAAAIVFCCGVDAASAAGEAVRSAGDEPLARVDDSVSRDPDVRAADPPGPNVLFIVVDDLRPELGCYGKPYIHSPNIDRLAASGVLFTHAYCQIATCNASRTSFMLGMRPDSTGVFENRQHFRDTLGSKVVTLAEHFKNHRYVSIGLGKVFHASQNDAPSWDVQNDCVTKTVWFRPENQSAAAELAVSKAASQPERALARLSGGPPYEWSDTPDHLHDDGVLTDEAIRQLRRVKDRKFFLAVGYHRPHLPFNAPKKYWDLYDPAEIRPSEITDWPHGAPRCARTNSNELRRYQGMPKKGDVGREEAINLIHGYRACVSFVDACIGRVLEELERLNLDDDTIVVLFGDHGFKLGEYSAWTKHTNYEIDTHVPLLIRVPGKSGRGTHSDALVELVDIYPTLCELAGLPLPGQLEGQSFVPLLDKPNRPWKKAAFSQFPRGQKGTGNGELMGYAMRTRTHLLVRWVSREDGLNVSSVASELYDQEKDPRQTVNIAADPQMASLVRQLEAECAIACSFDNDQPAHPRYTQFRASVLRVAGLVFLACGAWGCLCWRRSSPRRDPFAAPSSLRWMPVAWLRSFARLAQEKSGTVPGRQWVFLSHTLLLLGLLLLCVSFR